MIIPHRQLSPEALQGILEEIATREGTDYGEQETPLATKVCQLRRQLDAGHSVILFDTETETIGLASKDQLPEGLGNGED